jgi:uncharacterized protein YjbJ (UPF0337 family)
MSDYRGRSNMQIGRTDLNKLRGLSDKAFGLTREFVGTVAGNERWQKEGEAQQARATEQLRALREQVRAEGKQAQARVHEERQRAAPRAKERSSTS